MPFFHRFVAYPFGTYFGLKDQTKKIQIYHQPLLEAEYKKCKSPSHDAILVSRYSWVVSHDAILVSNY